MGVGRDGRPGVKFAQDGYAARGFIFVQDAQFDARVGAGLPVFVLGERGVRKHNGASG